MAAAGLGRVPARCETPEKGTERGGAARGSERFSPERGKENKEKRRPGPGEERRKKRWKQKGRRKTNLLLGVSYVFVEPGLCAGDPTPLLARSLARQGGCWFVDG